MQELSIHGAVLAVVLVAVMVAIHVKLVKPTKAAKASPFTLSHLIGIGVGAVTIGAIWLYYLGNLVGFVAGMGISIMVALAVAKFRRQRSGSQSHR